MEIKVSQKRELINKRIADLENDKFRLENLIPDSSGDLLACRRDHLDRVSEQIQLHKELYQVYEKYQSEDIIISDLHDGQIIVLSEGFEVENTIEFQQSVMNEIEGY